MSTLKVRKNFLLEKEIIEKAQTILSQQHKSLSEALNLYFKAVVKDPDILKEIEKSAKKRSGNFIGMLDEQIGDENWEDMKKKYADTSKRFK